jgi:hypothetical protein
VRGQGQISDELREREEGKEEGRALEYSYSYCTSTSTSADEETLWGVPKECWEEKADGRLASLGAGERRNNVGTVGTVSTVSTRTTGGRRVG